MSNNTYREFVQLITHYQISDNIANAFIHFFNKHSNLATSPLPSSMRKAKEVLDRSTISNAGFMKSSIPIAASQDAVLYYRPLLKAIKSLLAIPSINENLVLNYSAKYENGKKIYEEQFNSNWWKREETNLLSGQQLLSIIIYSDASTLDNLGKLSGHPVFISLGNIPNFQRQKPKVKTIVGYLPVLKAQDIHMKNS